MWTGRGWFCFNCLKSLANSLSLECGMTSTLSVLHSLACSRSLCVPSDNPAARGKILRPDDRVSKTDPIITGAMSVSPCFCFLHHIFVWLACLTLISASHTGRVCFNVYSWIIMSVWLNIFPHYNRSLNNHEQFILFFFVNIILE